MWTEWTEWTKWTECSGAPFNNHTVRALGKCDYRTRYTPSVRNGQVRPEAPFGCNQRPRENLCRQLRWLCRAFLLHTHSLRCGLEEYRQRCWLRSTSTRFSARSAFCPVYLFTVYCLVTSNLQTKR